MPPIYQNEFVVVDADTLSISYSFKIRCPIGTTRDQAVIAGQDILRNFILQPRTMIYFRTMVAKS